MKGYLPVFTGWVMMLPIIGALFAIFGAAMLLVKALKSRQKLKSLGLYAAIFLIIAFIHLSFSNLNFTMPLLIAMVLVPFLLHRFDKSLDWADFT